MMKSILITGSNRGLGLGLVKSLLRDVDPPPKIVATCRNIEKAQELREIAERNSSVRILELDVTDFGSYEEFSRKVDEIVGEEGLNVLVNNAGVATKFTRLPMVKQDQMVGAYSVNVVAPVLLTKALLNQLKLGASKEPSEPLGCKRALVVNMSSVLGSIELNEHGGYYPYRCSKAALNIATRSMSIDLKGDGIMAVAVHPGWVKTAMGGSNAPLEVDVSTASLVKLIKTISETHNGGFYQWDGKPVAW